MVDAIKAFFNALSNPTVYFFLTVVLLGFYLAFRKTLTKPAFALGFLGFSVAFFIFSLFDPNFRTIITKPDNVPIVMMLGLVLYLTWLALRRAVVNDDLMRRGEPNLEAKESKDRVFTWPDLVYTELICMVLCTVVLTVWSIELGAPLEEPAAAARTPNPSKAPWYFLGLQEMLVYYDPWIAGVVLPSFVIVGLMAVPYLDRNPKGNGYYTFEERPFAISFYLFGFLILWVSLVILGTFLRGAELVVLRALPAVGHPLPRAAREREPLGVFLGTRARAAPSQQYVPARAPRNIGGDRILRAGPAAAPLGEQDVPRLLPRDGARPLQRVRHPFVGGARPPHQDGPALDDQSEVHRFVPQILLQHLAGR